MKPAFENKNIAVACCSDNNYVPYLATLLLSIINNTSNDNNYDIIIIEDSISDINKNIICNLSLKKKNIAIRFLSISDYIEDADRNWTTPNKNWSRVIYYRMLIPYILFDYKKIVYLDCDIINLYDIAHMYNVDLDGYLIGAVRLMGRVNIGQNKMLNSTYMYAKYCFPELKMEDYFNSGALIINVKSFKETYSKEYILKFIGSQNYNLPDQDSLNVLCAKKIKYIDAGWNCYPYTKHELDNALKICPEDKKEYYREGYSHIKNIHYTIFKPWLEPYGKYAYASSFFWKYIINTPFADLVIKKMNEYQYKKTRIIEIKKKGWEEVSMFANNNKLILYGYGVKGKEFLTLYKDKFPVVGLYDQDKEKVREKKLVSKYIDLLQDENTVGDDFGIIISNDEWMDIANKLYLKGYKNIFSYKCLSHRERTAWNLKSEDFLKVECVGNFFNDDKSRQIFWEILNKREESLYDENVRYIDIQEGFSYFRNDIYHISDHEVYVDIGSYRGCTVEKFIEFVSGKFDKIYAFEMDYENYKYLDENAKEQRIITYNIALDDTKGTKKYFKADLYSTIDANGIYSVEGSTLDLLLSDEKISFIKINVNNTKNVIKGSKKIIKQNKPKLAICVGNNYSDLWEIPLLLKKICPEYKLLIRHHSENSMYTVLYAK